MDRLTICRHLVSARRDLASTDRVATIRHACFMLDIEAPDAAMLERMISFRADDADVIEAIVEKRRRVALDKIAAIANQRAARAN